MNADALIKENLYCYCQNEPLNNSDDNGNESLPIPYSAFANCYAYALRLPFDPRTKRPFDHLPQPGEFSSFSNVVNVHDWNQKLMDPNDFANKIIECAMNDAPYLGMKITRVENGNYETTDRSWLIALATSYHPLSVDMKLFSVTLESVNVNVNYHWWRKEKDGTWSHKPGKGDIMYEDFSHNVINDPRDSNRGGYNIFVGYFLVEAPWRRDL